MLLCTIIICVTILIGFENVKQSYITHDLSEQRDKCRIKQFFVDNGEQIYLCQSVYDKTTTYLIYPHDSKYVDKNPYINRPVIVYKNGTFK